jgi:protein-L-isoaspartate O-methyltransferase
MASDAASRALVGECAGHASLFARRARPAAETAEEVISILTDQRRYLAEELETVCGLRTSALVESFATVPREDFLPRAVEVDDALADAARRHLSAAKNVTVCSGDGSQPLAEVFDAVLVNCGVTDPLPVWLDAAALNQRLGQVLMTGQYPRINRLRQDPHEESAACWLHGSGFCLSA